MNRKILLIAILFPIVCLMSWVSFLFIQRETGQDIIVSVQGYDPRDLLSGHYIQYTIDWEKTNCQQFETGVCPKDEFCKEARWGRQCRFYIPENKAHQLDRLFWKRNSTDMIFEVVYSYHKNKTPIAKSLLINGKDWKEFIK